MNHLKGSLSPYLIQHANQAIDWYPWGPEAFAKARDEGKPILLSIGYSTCHWCHVMARESFDDQEVAELLNTYFVSIKVDREERPDIDAVYMAACIAMTGVGGWPLTIVMDAQQEPFFAATYLPKKAYYNRLGLMELLSSIVTLWEEDREGIKERQDRILDMIEEQVQGGKLPAQNLPLTEGSLTQGLLDLSRTFDPKDGGFGRAPKFPTPHKIFFLQAMQAAYNTETAQSMARTTLDAMARGGIFDPIAGGFARYSTDNQWLVPHFEKMLIDNALLAVAYLRQYQLDGDSHDLYVAKKTLSYMAQTLSSPGKAFYSAQDAESHGREGAFYALSFEDLLRALGAERAPAFAKAYGFTEEGNFHGANIPNRIHALHLTPPEAVFEEDLKKLDGYRKERLPLYTDQKIILSWNALAAYAFVVAYEVTGQEEYLEIAYEKRGILERELRFEEGGFARAERAGLKSGPAQLDDLAALARLDLALYRVNGQFDFLYSASKLLETIEDGFLDEKDGGYFMTSVGDETLIVRPKEWSDGAQMSANALMVGLLNELWQMTGIEVYKERLNALIAAYQTLPSLSLLNHAHFHREFLYVLTAAENVVTTANQEDLGPWREYLAKPSGSLRTLVLLDEFGRDYFLRSDSYLGEIPYKNDRWYLCQNFSCQKPAKSFEDLGLL